MSLKYHAPKNGEAAKLFTISPFVKRIWEERNPLLTIAHYESLPSSEWSETYKKILMRQISAGFGIQGH